MNEYYIAKIKWVPYSEGGRKTLIFEETRYCPMIKFNNSNENENISWSADINCMSTNNKLESIIEIKFLVDDSPTHLMKPNNSFSLYEGKRKVADGIILHKK